MGYTYINILYQICKPCLLHLIAKKVGLIHLRSRNSQKKEGRTQKYMLLRLEKSATLSCARTKFTSLWVYNSVYENSVYSRTRRRRSACLTHYYILYSFCSCLKLSGNMASTNLPVNTTRLWHKARVVTRLMQALYTTTTTQGSFLSSCKPNVKYKTTTTKYIKSYHSTQRKLCVFHIVIALSWIYVVHLYELKASSTSMLFIKIKIRWE